MNTLNTKRKSILITGGLGFIGSHLALKLYDKYDIVIIDWDCSPETEWKVQEFKSKGIVIYQSDIANPTIWKNLESCDYVFHAAAQVAAVESEKDPIRDFQTNAYGTFLVAEYARENSAHVIYCNTIRVYDSDAVDEAIQGGGKVSENCRTVMEAYKPQPPFALSKYTGEQYLRQYSRMYGLCIISNRMSGIVGPSQIGKETHGWLAHLISCAKEDRTFRIYGDGEQSRDVLHVADFLDLIIMELEDFEFFAEDGFAVYNIGGGPDNELSINEVIGILDNEYGYKLHYKKEGPRSSEPQHYITDLTRISKKGWHPKHTNKKALIEEFVKWH